MLSDEVRVRFAPSPTGFLHVGGVRTALFNWLYARHFRGKFLLRIEDTDLERSEARYTEDILACLRWLGIDWDEDPLYQSQRTEIYQQEAERLLSQGSAYYCSCTEADVEKMRAQALAQGAKPQYDRRCREKGLKPEAGVPMVLRAKVPLDGFVEFDDLVYGKIRVDNKEIDDFVLIRSGRSGGGGSPTYNFTVVVDDVASRMTHIIRGDDHINNTPKQIHLYHLLKYPVPKFAHLSMILGADKKKLSKRHGDVSANRYREEGFLPEALLNFLVRLGWSHGNDEVFTIDQMIAAFDFDHVQKSSAVFNSEKLLWLNGAHLKNVAINRLQKLLEQDFSKGFSEAALARLKTGVGAELIRLSQSRVKTLKDLSEQLAPVLDPGIPTVDPSTLKCQKDPVLKAKLIAAALDVANSLTARVAQTRSDTLTLKDHGLSVADVEAIFREVSERAGVKLGELCEPVRLAVTGRLVSAGLFEIIAILPWAEIESRMKRMSDFC